MKDVHHMTASDITYLERFFIKNNALRDFTNDGERRAGGRYSTQHRRRRTSDRKRSHKWRNNIGTRDQYELSLAP